MGVVSIDAVSAAEVTDPSICLVELSDSTATLSWFDGGGTHVIRRDGRWLATPGSNESSFVDQSSPPSATYLVRTWIGGNSQRSGLCSSITTDVLDHHYHDRAGGVIEHHDHHLDVDVDVDIFDDHDDHDDHPATSVDRLCFVRNGSAVTLRWLDEGGTHVLRRNDRWLATPGRDTSTFVDDPSPPGATYVLRTWLGSQFVDKSCIQQQSPPPPPPPPPVDRLAERVIHVSIDGLRSDHVTPVLMPNLTRLMAEGAWTLNARTDPAYTQTLPNHHSQFTGRPVYGAGGHHVDFNNDLEHHGPRRGRHVRGIGVRRRP